MADMRNNSDYNRKINRTSANRRPVNRRNAVNAGNNTHKRKRNKKRGINSGRLLFIDPAIVVFSILALVLCLNMVGYFFKPHVKIYEVNEGSIATDYSYKGLAIRNEEVVTANQAGYITYYARDLEKTGAKTTVYSIDETGELTDLLSDESITATDLTKEQLLELNNNVSSFYNNFSNFNYDEVYNFKQDVEATTIQLIQQTLIDNSTQNVSGSAFHVENSPMDGIISYSVDGFEDYTVEQISSSQLSDDAINDYKAEDLRNQTLVKSGDKIFKIITNDEWAVVIKTDETTAKKLVEEEYVAVEFKKDNSKINGKVTSWESDGETLVAFSFTNSMIRYAQDRFLDISFEVDNISGLKVPSSAIAENELYAIDKSYLVTGASGELNSCYVESYDENGQTQTKEVTLDIKYENEETVYLNLNGKITAGTTIRAGGTTKERMTVGKTEKLKGVYVYNTGEPVFYPVNILDEDEYCIISPQSRYGLSKYDYIVLNSDVIELDK